MQRRVFVTGLAGVVAAPRIITAQERRRIGILTAGPVADRAHLHQAFRQRLQELGHNVGQNISVDTRSAEGRIESLPGLAADLVGSGITVIFADTTVAVQAAMKATDKIPIVMGSPGDPVGTALVASLAQPGGNVTGTTTLAPELSGKRLALVTELVNSPVRAAVLWNARNAASVAGWRETQAAGGALGLTLRSFTIDGRADLEPALASIAADGRNTLIVLPDTVFFAARRRIADFAIRTRLATAFEQREHVEAGGLMAYGPNLALLYRRAADYVDKILKGASARDLPVEQPTNFELVINVKTAKTLGVTIPPSLLLRADHVIE